MTGCSSFCQTMANFNVCRIQSSKNRFVLLLFIAMVTLVIYYMPLPTEGLNHLSKHLTNYYKNPKVISPSHNQTVNATHTPRTVTNSSTTTLVSESTSTAPPTGYHEVYPRNYHFIIDEPDKCEQEKPFLVLMVPVAPHQLEARNAIRSTWGNESVVQGKAIRVLFSLGLPGIKAEKQQEELILESQEHHDLIQSDFMDTYLNLTIKTMVIMDWLATRCPQATYAMKVDSDMFLNLDNMMKLLLAPETPRENYMTGMVMWNRPVIRDPANKWYVSKEMYAEDYYPTYLLGMGYLFSNDLPERLVEASKNVKPFTIEDAYVGACLKQLGLAPSSPPDPSQFQAYFNGNYKREEFQRVITTILNSPQQLIQFWQDSRRPT